MEKKIMGQTSLGMDPNIAGLLSYVLGWVTGLIFFLIEKDNKFVRFHAIQSMIVFGALSVLQIVIGLFITTLAMMHLGALIALFGLINSIVFLAGIVLWILMMVKAYQGEKFKLPIAGDIAEKNA